MSAIARPLSRRARPGARSPIRRLPRRSTATIAVGCALLWAGCGGDEPPQTPARPPPAAARENPLPGFQTPLKGGTTYTTEQFQPAVRITVPDDGEWTTEVGDTPEHFSILTDGDFGQALIALHRITRVYDPEQGGLEPGDMVPLKGGFAEWLTDHPHLQVSTQQVELLDASGVQIDFSTRSSPPRTPDQFCGHAGDDCVPLFYDGLDTIAYGKQVKGRFIVVPLDDGGEIVIEQYASPAEEFDRALAVLRPLLESLQLANS